MIQDRQVSRIGVACPRCAAGRLEYTEGPFGAFYKCSNVRGCDYWLNGRPIGRTCDFTREDGSECGAPMVEGKRTIPDRCSDRECPNRHPHRLTA